ncbi:MAG TPA: HEAT repeat domain-containing protein, partial [Elusimicrobiales bacterium]|nr:HEAT repeat domain-containing protein [Elusimicrobiales bacterium]
MRRTQAAALSLFILFSPRHGAAQEPPAEISGRELGRRALEITLAYVKDRDPDVRGMAAAVLGQAGNKSAAGILKKLLADPDKHARINAAEALWKLGEPSGLKAVYAIIGDEPARNAEGDSPLAELRIISRNKLREHAIEAFARMKGDKAGTMLYELKNDRFGTIRDAAARELARLGYAEEMTQFLEATGSEDEGIRFQGASILASICSPAAAERLAALLTPNESMRVRIAALDGIKCSGGGKAALKTLLELADDPNPTLRFKAVSALGSVRDGKAFEKLK